MTALARIVWLLSGMLWAAVSLIQFAHPNYWDPVTPLDWSAVWLYSAAWLLFAPSMLFLGRLVLERQVMTIASVIAIGALGTGLANAFEDGFGVSWMGTLYVVGVLAAGIGMVPLAVTLRRAGYSRLAGLSVAIFAGMLTFTIGGGLIILGAFASLAIVPRWFRAAPPEPRAAQASVG